MKKSVMITVGILLGLGLVGCGNQNSVQDTSVSLSETKTTVLESLQESSVLIEESMIETSAAESETEAETSENTILIVYFSVPEDVDISGTDAVAGASVVVKNEVKMGNTEYVAKLVQQTVGGDLFRIETVDVYPFDHGSLVDQAADEQDENARPALADQIEDISQYDTIILGYPNWWADLPMPVYTFLEEYDLAGKTIIPFVTHGGSGFSNTVNTIGKLQPGAVISKDTLSLSRGSVAGSEEDVILWASGLGL